MKYFFKVIGAKFNKNIFIKYIISTGFLCLVVGIVIIVNSIIQNYGKINELNGPPTLPGADKINPAVMYNGTIYYWKHLAGQANKAPQGELPEGYEYVGDIENADTGELTKDFQFIAAFKAIGQLYYNMNSPNNVCICITTDWMENAYVIFSSK